MDLDEGGVVYLSAFSPSSTPHFSASDLQDKADAIG